MRFKIQYGSEDVNERSVPLNSTKILLCTICTEFYFLFCRRSGMITGSNVVDPIRWTGSKWKSLQVGILVDCIKHLGLSNSERHYVRPALQYFG